MRGSKSKCNLSIERNLPYVKIDEDQISQVIQNIVINASHSMSEGGIISINTESKKLDAENELSLPRGEYIKISIGDQGEGISSEHISKIFDPYFTTKVGGTGLGLSTSYSIVQKHNGLLTVDSEQGVGTSFHIYLPVCEGSAPVFKEEKSSAVRGEGRILVMDDEKKIRETIGEMLSILGYVPILTSSGEEAIKKYKESIEYESAFDAVILDLTIPGGMGGKETIKRLREISPDIIGLVSSGYSNDPVLSNFQEYGFKGAVKKPYSIVKLSEMLQTVLADSVKPSPV
jgi:CheY-like chemotaxis protein